MKILIVGNMGYVGSVLANHLRSRSPQAELIGFDSGYFAHCLIGDGPLPETVLDQQYFGDTRRLPAACLRGVDVVIQLAALSNDPLGKAFEHVTASINCDAAVQVAHAARQAGVKAFVFASSCSVYGSGGPAVKDESSPLEPLTAYAHSKIDAERQLEILADDRMSVTCLRFATACGWSPRLRLDLVLNDFVAAAVTSKRIEILSDGTPWRPLIHVRDMARAIDWASHRPADSPNPFVVLNVGSDAWNCQVRDLAQYVAEQLPGVDVQVNASAAPDRRSYRVDFSRFHQLAPDHQPQVTAAEAVTELAQELRRAGFRETNFRQSNLIRLNVLHAARQQRRLDDNLFPA